MNKTSISTSNFPDLRISATPPLLILNLRLLPILQTRFTNDNTKCRISINPNLAPNLNTVNPLLKTSNSTLRRIRLVLFLAMRLPRKQLTVMVKQGHLAMALRVSIQDLAVQQVLVDEWVSRVV